jgi:hypothetical protein
VGIHAYWTEQAIHETWTELKDSDDRKLAVSMVTLAELASSRGSLPQQWQPLIRNVMGIQEGTVKKLFFNSKKEKHETLKAFIDFAIRTAMQ